MKKNLLYLYLVIALILIGYIIFKSYDFHKYHSKLKMEEVKPPISLGQLLSKNNLEEKYIKTLTYNNNFLGFNAIINNKSYVSVTYLGKINGDLKIEYQKGELKKNEGVGLPPTDVLDDTARFINFYDYPFKISTIGYQIQGHELQIANNKFEEIVFNGNYFIISLNNKKKKDFALVSSNKKMSISFINYNNGLYIVNTQSYKDNSFYSLHSILKE